MLFNSLQLPVQGTAHNLGLLWDEIAAVGFISQGTQLISRSFSLYSGSFTNTQRSCAAELELSSVCCHQAVGIIASALKQPLAEGAWKAAVVSRGSTGSAWAGTHKLDFSFPCTLSMASKCEKLLQFTRVLLFSCSTTIFITYRLLFSFLSH